MNQEELLKTQFPLEWLNSEVMEREVGFSMSVQAATIIHGLIRLALKHPTLPETSRGMGLDFKAGLEQMMERAGLPPPHRGWDADSAWSCPLCKEDLQENEALDVIYCSCGWSSLRSEFLKGQAQVA